MKSEIIFDQNEGQFHREWVFTLDLLNSIANRINDNKPAWINDDVPTLWHVHQFLHAYYFNKIGTPDTKPYEDYYQIHFKNPNAELKSQLAWWRDMTTAPSNEDEMLHKKGPVVRELLSKDKVLTLKTDEFEY